MKDLIITALAAVLAGIVLLSFNLKPFTSVNQPIEYNHKKHIELGLDCSTCHTGIGEQETFAGLPQLDTCLTCHMEDDTNPKSKVLQVYAAKNESIPWKKIYRVPEHVYFSHRRHVTVGKLDCALCHGDMSKMETPVVHQTVKISMTRCINCHRKMNVTNDCMACHK